MIPHDPEIPVLYTFRRCPYAMRARLAVRYSGIAVELREVDLKLVPGELSRASAKETVPVLVLPDGKVLDESWDILLWSLRRNDPDCWLDGFLQSDLFAAVMVRYPVWKPGDVPVIQGI